MPPDDGPKMSSPEQQDLWEASQPGSYVALTTRPLDIPSHLDRVRSPKAGALVLFAGTTRDNFASKPVLHLSYSAYHALALRTLSDITASLLARHGPALTALAVVHRLGAVPVGEESILVAASAPHRQAAWRAGEEALELCKDRLEVWKLEQFGGDEGGVWRANRDGQPGVRVDGGEEAGAEGL